MHDKPRSDTGVPLREVDQINPKVATGIPLSITAPLQSLWTVDLRERRMLPEWMDQPDIDPQALQGALRALESYNAICFSHRRFWKQISKLARRSPHSEIRVLDVACGGGDITVNLARLAQRSKLKVTVDGCDLSPTAVAFATERARQAGVNSQFFQFDVNQENWPTHYDVICSSLFLHHLPTALAQETLRRMGQATRHLVLINDLIRCRYGYAVIRIGTLLVTQSPVARYDGPISVAGSFTVRELRQMAQDASLTGAKVFRCWPVRMQLVWRKS